MSKYTEHRILGPANHGVMRKVIIIMIVTLYVYTCIILYDMLQIYRMDINNQVTCEVQWEGLYVRKIAIDPVHG